MHRFVHTCTCAYTHIHFPPENWLLKPLPTHRWPRHISACAQGLRNLMDHPERSCSALTQRDSNSRQWALDTLPQLLPLASSKPTAKLLSPVLSVGMDAETGRRRGCRWHQLPPGSQLGQQEGPAPRVLGSLIHAPPTSAGCFRVASGAAPCKSHPISGLTPSILVVNAQHTIL